MKKIITAIILTSLTLLNITAQEYAPIEDVDLIDKHKGVLKKALPNAFDNLKVEGVYRINKQFSSIIYFENEVYNEAVINSARKDMLLIITLTEITESNAPKIVIDNHKRGKYGDWEIERILSVKSPQGETYYAVDIKSDNENKRLFYDDYGNSKKAPY
jgi:uncharacterized membrane protein YkoI